MNEEYTKEYVDGLLDKIWRLEEEVNDLKAEAEITEKTLKDITREFGVILWELERI